MSTKPRRLKLSPATVIATIALLVALSGTSYATVLQVPRNSVGTAHLRNNAVVSSKVRNGSLLRADFRAGQIPAGPAGQAGPAGPTGSAGPAGPPGAVGPSDAFGRAIIGPIALGGSGFVTVGNLSIPQAGRYVIWAKTELHSSSATGQATCILVAGNDQIDETSALITATRYSGLALLAMREFAAAGSVDFRCFSGTTVSVLHLRMAAIRVANLTVTT